MGTGETKTPGPVIHVPLPMLILPLPCCYCSTCKAVHPCSTLGSEEQLVLPGYGVEVVLKNMEYSAMDDKAKADAAAAAKKAAKKAQKASADGSATAELADIDVSSLGEVKGFKFDVLAQRKPHLVQELMTFRDVLMSNDEEEAIKVKSGAVAMGVMHLWQAFSIFMLLIRKQSCDVDDHDFFAVVSVLIKCLIHPVLVGAVLVECLILAHDPWYDLCACGVQVWDLKDAGLQAASRVAAASDPLALLAEISQNFLSLVSSLTRQKVGLAVWVSICEYSGGGSV